MVADNQTKRVLEPLGAILIFEKTIQVNKCPIMGQKV